MIRAFLTSKGTVWALFWAVVAALWAALWCLLPPEVDVTETPITEAALTLGMGLVLALRINRAYDRWWEGRKLWGQLVNVSRNLAVKVRSFGRPTAAEAETFARGIPGFAWALRDHLRAGANLERVPGYADRPERPKHVPSWLVRHLYDLIHASREEGRITDEEMRTLDLEARELLNVCGACERIRNTPMPPSLAALVRITMALVLAGFPVTAFPYLGWWTVPATAGAAFFIVIGESTASVIERPFGTDPNELDLTRLCTVIETTVHEILEFGPVED